jgi:hypothetical protein
MIADLPALVGAVSVVAAKSDIVIVTHPTQAVAIGLRSPGTLVYAVLPSNHVPAKSVVAIATNALASATGGDPNIEVSQQTAYHEADPGLPVVDIGGVLASPIRSMFQTDAVSLRMLWPLSWALRDPRGVAHMANVLW